MSHNAENDAPTCGEQYGKNPDPCYRAAGHVGAHSNKWGTTWASARQWQERIIPPGGDVA